MALAIDSAELHRLTAEEYRQLVGSGALEDARVELIDGLLCDMSPPRPAHDQPTVYLTRVLALALDHDRYELRPNCALTLGNSSPQPDFAVVERGTPRPWHPGSAALVIEVAVASRRRDLVVKPSIYAAAGVAEYWVIDVERSRAVVHRGPSTDGYRSRVELGPDDVLDGAVIGIGAIPVGEVLAPAGR